MISFSLSGSFYFLAFLESIFIRGSNHQFIASSSVSRRHVARKQFFDNIYSTDYCYLSYATNNDNTIIFFTSWCRLIAWSDFTESIFSSVYLILVFREMCTLLHIHDIRSLNMLLPFDLTSFYSANHRIYI